ncbi:MAG TPA: SAM-dependent methyltransferase [Ideonella sp.]|uniref:class I SAM-dependent methyltransferase n=1 Tax=Ideonella sp. TaxID=1929293 RepID=UPI002E3183D1|nr:SAM-dependent methyltransferase [Ideonella sp.]HEX5685580.1 SAM-dependent methyltransferase [Ideonella sp.]
MSEASQNQNIIHRGEPSRTAQYVATLRAVHALLDDPIVLDDPVALPLLGAETAAALKEDPFGCNDPMARSLRAGLVARSRVAEDELARRVDAGLRQYVLLGAGLDTFSARNTHAAQGLRVFEVDHASTQRWKREALQAAGLDVGDTAFVSVDFERDDLLQALRGAGLRTDLPVLFAWLGVTMYLTPDAVLKTLAAVGTLPPGSGIVFDYRLPPEQLNPVERVLLDVVAQQIAALGEPWLSSFDPATLKRQLLELGYTHIDDVGSDELNRRYFFRRKDGLQTRNGVRIMCAGR